MIICPQCNSESVDLKPSCRVCGFQPEFMDGFNTWALARDNSGFNSQLFSGLAQVEAKHLWFCARKELILWALGKYFPEATSFLEVSCGTGFVLSGIARKFPEIRLIGGEIYIAEFDVVCAIDVIEHVQEDDLLLRNIYRAIKTGGGCMLTVLQHMWLWGAVDEQACRKRRYSARELHSKVEKAGFQILRSTSFVSSLLPVMALSRFFQRKVPVNDIDATEGMKLPPWLNSLFFKTLSVEPGLIKMRA